MLGVKDLLTQALREGGLVFPRPAFIETGKRGWEHLTPEDTFDADYGLVLENAVKGWCAQHDSNVRPPGS